MNGRIFVSQPSFFLSDGHNNQAMNMYTAQSVRHVRTYYGWYQRETSRQQSRTLLQSNYYSRWRPRPRPHPNSSSSFFALQARAEFSLVFFFTNRCLIRRTERVNAAVWMKRLLFDRPIAKRYHAVAIGTRDEVFEHRSRGYVGPVWLILLGAKTGDDERNERRIL